MFKNRISKKNKIDKKDIIRYIEIIIGTFLIAFSINVFFLPNNISSGGASGIGIILNYLFKIPVSITIVVINIPLFILAVKRIGWKFSINTIIGTILMAFFTGLTTGVSEIEIFKTGTDMIISSIFGGVILGVGISFVFRGRSSTGGSELLAQIVYKDRPSLNVSTLMLIIDSAIILFSIIAFKSINSGLYSLIAIFVSKKTIDIVFGGVNYTKVVNIITKKENEICRRIFSEIDRGATALKCVGKYTGDDFTKIECVVTMPQIARLREIVREEDKEAFMYIGAANEVLGYGFEKKGI